MHRSLVPIIVPIVLEHTNSRDRFGSGIPRHFVDPGVPDLQAHACNVCLCTHPSVMCRYRYTGLLTLARCWSTALYTHNATDFRTSSTASCSIIRVPRVKFGNTETPLDHLELPETSRIVRSRGTSHPHQGVIVTSVYDPGNLMCAWRLVDIHWDIS